MICLECGRTIKNINYRHLQSCSGLTPQSYLLRHPDTQLVDEEVKKTYSQPLEKNPRWKGGMENRKCEDCGCKISKHAFVVVCRKCSIKRSGNPFAGQRHTEATRARMKEAAKKRDPETYKFGTAPSEEISRRQKERWARIPIDERHKLIQSFIRAGQLHNKKASKTRIENIVDELLQSRGLKYERNVQIGRYNVDFLIESTLVIECFGDFWHCNPRLYSAADYNKSLHLTAGEKWEKDRRRIDTLRTQGFHILQLWEYDIRNDSSLTQESIDQFLEIYDAHRYQREDQCLE